MYWHYRYYNLRSAFFIYPEFHPFKGFIKIWLTKKVWFSRNYYHLLHTQDWKVFQPHSKKNYNITKWHLWPLWPCFAQNRQLRASEKISTMTALNWCNNKKTWIHEFLRLRRNLKDISRLINHDWKTKRLEFGIKKVYYLEFNICTKIELAACFCKLQHEDSRKFRW